MQVPFKTGAATGRASMHLQPTSEARANGNHAALEQRLAALEVRQGPKSCVYPVRLLHQHRICRFETSVAAG